MGTSGFAERLRLLVETLKIEHQILARAGGISKATFSNYMHGEKLPRMETLANWIAKYNINANWLISGQGSMFLDGQVTVNTLSSLDDPVIERMKAAVQLLKQANATDEVIQNAILATLDAKKSAS